MKREPDARVAQDCGSRAEMAEDPGLVHWSPANSCEALVVMRGIEFLRELRLEAVDCAFNWALARATCLNNGGTGRI